MLNGELKNKIDSLTNFTNSTKIECSENGYNFTFMLQVQKMLDEYIDKLDVLYVAKEKEIMEV